MGNITKSLWTNIKHAVHAIPGSSDLIPWANHAGTDLVTEINECTVAELISGGGGASDIGLRKATLILTDAQIKTLPTVTQILVPRVAGAVIFPISMMLEVDTTAGAYTHIDAAAVFCIKPKNSSSPGGSDLVTSNLVNNAAAGATMVSDIFGAAAATISLIPCPNAEGFAVVNVGTGVGSYFFGNFEFDDPASFVDLDLRVEILNQASGDLTGGNAANRAGITMIYAQIPTLL